MGNLNHDTPEVRELEPLMMRYLRVHPERGSQDGLGLRLEVLGCDAQGENATMHYNTVISYISAYYMCITVEDNTTLHIVPYMCVVNTVL